MFPTAGIQNTLDVERDWKHSMAQTAAAQPVMWGEGKQKQITF